MQNAHRRLMWHGMFLFLLGLFTGFAEPHFVNMRMGLAAHLEGVLNRHFSSSVGRYVERGSAFSRRKSGGILDRALRQLRELAGDDPRGRIWNWSLVAYYSFGSHGARLARTGRNDRFRQRRDSDHFMLATRPLGASREGPALERALNPKTECAPPLM
jgi:hypothetical protein